MLVPLEYCKIGNYVKISNIWSPFFSWIFTFQPIYFRILVFLKCSSWSIFVIGIWKAIIIFSSKLVQVLEYIVVVSLKRNLLFKGTATTFLLLPFIPTRWVWYFVTESDCVFKIILFCQISYNFLPWTIHEVFDLPYSIDLMWSSNENLLSLVTPEIFSLLKLSIAGYFISMVTSLYAMVRGKDDI